MSAIEIIYNMPAGQYHADKGGPRLSQSLATLACTKSALHAWQAHPLLGGAGQWRYEPSDDDGTLIHSLVLEPDGQQIYEIDPSTITTKDGKPAKSPLATVEGKAIRDAALAAGRIPILSDKLGAYRYKAKAIRQRFEALGLEFSGQSEVVIYWDVNGVACRCRLDHLIETPAGIRLIDLKTCESAHPHDSQRTAWLKGYDIQRAAYVEAVEFAFPAFVGRVSYELALCELDRPYACNLIQFSPSFARIGELRWNRGRDRWAEALRSDSWNGYAGATIEEPPWAKTEEMSES